MPRVGVWRADLTLDLEDASKVGDEVTLSVDGLEWKGTAVEVGAYTGRVHLRMAGGNAGMPKPVVPRFYRAMPARVVAQDLLAEGGEELSSTANQDVLSSILPLWTRASGIVSEALEQLLDELGATWRVLADGTVWVGTETWPEASNVKDVIVLAEVPNEARIEFGSATPNLVPGTTFRGRRVSRVEIHISPSDVHTKAWFDEGDGGGDVMRVAIERLVRQATRHFDYFATYSGKAVAQNTDGTLELRLDSTRLPGMSRVPIRVGVMTLKVKTGAEVNVVFLNGSPARPSVTYVDPKSLLETTLDPSTKVKVDAIEVVTQNGRPLARVGDMVQVISTPPGTPAIGQIMTGNNLHRG